MTRPRTVVDLLARSGLIAPAGAVVLPCVTTYFVVLRRPAAPKPTLPSPNGYDDLLAAANLLRPTNVQFRPDSATPVQLQRDVAGSAKAIRRLRAGLSKPCERHPDYHPEAGQAASFQYVARFRSLSEALIVEGASA